MQSEQKYGPKDFRSKKGYGPVLMIEIEKVLEDKNVKDIVRLELDVLRVLEG